MAEPIRKAFPFQTKLSTGISLLINFDVFDWLIGVGVLVVLLPSLWWRKRNLSYLLFFSIFWVYLLGIVQAVVFPIALNTNYNGTTFTPSVNLIPFYFGSCYVPAICARNILENILLTIPFGFGINFLVRIKPRNFLWLSIAIGLGFELSHLVISLVFRSGFRAVDINDVIFNAIGVLLGYALFRAFSWVYLKTTSFFEIKHKGLFAEIYNVVFQAEIPGKSKNA